MERSLLGKLQLGLLPPKYILENLFKIKTLKICLVFLPLSHFVGVWQHKRIHE